LIMVKNSRMTEEPSEDGTLDEASFSKGNNGRSKKNKGSTSMAAIEKDFKRMDRFISALTNTTKGQSETRAGQQTANESGNQATGQA
jgi:hypothetical protein